MYVLSPLTNPFDTALVMDKTGVGGVTGGGGTISGKGINSGSL